MSRLEVFGPVTCVYGFSRLDEAIRAANGLPFAFQASVFTREIGPALKAAEMPRCVGGDGQRHTAFRTDWMPFAGLRQSGLGVGGIPYSMHEMAQEKMLVLHHD